MRWGSTGPELVEMRWGFEPHSGGEPVINVRAETADLTSHRCLVPARDFELFTGAGQPKRRWTVTLRGETLFFFAGLWRAALEDWPESYAIITTEAAMELAPLTDRQPAIIRASDARRWLSDAEHTAELLRPLEPGSYRIEG